MQSGELRSGTNGHSVPVTVRRWMRPAPYSVTDGAMGWQLFAPCLKLRRPRGRRIIINKQLGRKVSNEDLDEPTHLLESGPDRIGALNFQ